MEVKEAYLTPNQFSRPGIKLRGVYGLVLHYVGNAGTSAMFNRNFFEHRKHGKTGYGSAHFIVDLGGDVLVVVPPNEVAYHCGENRANGNLYTSFAIEKFGYWPNGKTIGIEMCHLDIAGRLSDETLEATRNLCACLCSQFNLDSQTDIVRHFDITGKLCPRWWVEHERDFLAFKASVHQKLLSNACNTGNGN